jgi:hypothetical protein
MMATETVRGNISSWQSRMQCKTSRRRGATPRPSGSSRSREAFAIGTEDSCAVSNAAFAEVLAATGHVTQADRCRRSFVLGALHPDDFAPPRAVGGAGFTTPYGKQPDPSTGNLGFCCAAAVPRA